MIQTTFKRQRKKRDLELIRLNRNGTEMVKIYCAGLRVAHTQGLHTELTRLCCEKLIRPGFDSGQIRIQQSGCSLLEKNEWSERKKK